MIINATITLLSFSLSIIVIFIINPTYIKARERAVHVVDNVVEGDFAGLHDVVVDIPILHHHNKVLQNRLCIKINF